MTEQLVILNIVDGIADTHHVHIPAVSKRFGHLGQIELLFDNRNFPPAHWPSLCGTIPAGWVYAHAGLLEDAPVCPACRLAEDN